MGNFNEDIFSAKEDRRLGILYESALVLAELEPDGDIYECLARQLVRVVPNAICVVNAYNTVNGLLTVRSVKGEDSVNSLLTNKMGQNIVGMEMSVEYSDYEKFTNNTVQEFKVDINELSKVNNVLSQAVEKLPEIGSVFVFGLAWKNNLYGDVSILLKKEQDNFDVTLVRIISRHAAIMLQKRKADIDQKSRESFLEGAIKSSVLGMMLLNLSRNIYFANPSFCNLVGYTEEELTSNQFIITHPDDIADSDRNLESLVNGDCSYITIKKRYIHKNGSVLWVEHTSTIQRNDKGEPEFFIIQVKDISSIISIEESLKVSEANLKAVFNVSSNIIMLTDLEGQIIEINNTFPEMLGIQIEDMIGKNIFNYIPQEIRDERIKHLQEVIKDGIAVQFEDSSNGRTWQNLIYPIKDEKGNVTRIAAYGNNITRIKAAEAENKQLFEDLTLAKEKAIQSDLLKSSLLSNMSHEFRTPLNGILGFTEILRELMSDPEQCKMVDIINDSGRRLFQTLDDILMIAELDSSSCLVQLTAIDPWNLINALTSRYKSEIIRKQLTLNTQIVDIPDFELVSDKDLIEKALERILRNAIKFTEKGGITIKTQKLSDGSNHSILISISDTGIGIADEDQEKIFKSFRQVSEGMGREFEGNGLGLSIAKKLIQLLNGMIRVSSQKGVGTTFIIELPLRAKSDVYPIVESEPEITTEGRLQTVIAEFGRKPRILLVEDNNYNAILAISFLENYCEIKHASDGAEAITMIKNEKFDFILMDINLGIGINGIETTREIRKIEGYENIPVAALTGYVLKGEQDKLFSLGLTHYLGKPYRMIELHDMASSILTQIMRSGTK